MNNKSMTRMAGAIIVVAIIIVVGAGVYFAYDSGYIPWAISPQLPDSYSEPTGSPSTDTAQCQFCEDAIRENVPSYTEINHKLYYIVLTPQQVIDTYRQDLENKGYHIYVHGETEIIGTITLEGYEIYYAVFEKGLTGVVVLSVESQSKEGSCVLYAVGPLWEFEIIYNEMEV